MDRNYAYLDLSKKAFVFELDDVLLPERDYLLQVYYLFAGLLEYTQQDPPAAKLMAYMKESLEKQGADGMFSRIEKQFEIAHTHKEQFNSMHVGARLPLKLLLYKEALGLLTYLIGEGKSVFVLTKGNPMMQFNKVKQTDWKGLEGFIKVYYYDEIMLKSALTPLDYLLEENQLQLEEVLCIYPEGQPAYWQSAQGEVQGLEGTMLNNNRNHDKRS